MKQTQTCWIKKEMYDSMPTSLFFFFFTQILLFRDTTKKRVFVSYFYKSVGSQRNKFNVHVNEKEVYGEGICLTAASV